MTYQFENFSEFLKIISHNNLYEKALQDATRKYKTRHYKI